MGKATDRQTDRQTVGYLKKTNIFFYHKVYIAIVSALITIPVNLILVGLFKTIVPSSKSSKSAASQSSDHESTEDEYHEEESHVNAAFEIDDTHHEMGLVTGIYNSGGVRFC